MCMSKYVGTGLLTETDLAYVGLGSNLDRPLEQLSAAGMKLATVGEVQARSSIYLTEPVGGPPNQPLYLNAVLVLAPGARLDRPEALLEALLEIERGQGRVRRERWGARSLDLDLLSVGGRIVDRPQLTLPHPRMMGRAFVLAPLCEVAPGWRHPVTAEGACEALERVGSEFVVRTDLAWQLG